MTMKLVPTSLLYEQQTEEITKMIEELCEVPPNEWSPREKKLMDDAMGYGCLYHADIVRMANCLVVSTDLGDPDSKIELRVPLFVEEKKALRALQHLAETLLEGE